MKILQIGKFFPPYLFGGIETVSFSLHQALQNQEGIEADFIGFLPKKYKHDIEVDEKVYLCKTDVEKFSTQFSFSFLKIYKEKRNSYDIILVNMPHPVANLAIYMFPPKRAKLVLVWHSDIVKQKKLLFLYKPFLINLIKRSSSIIAPTHVHLDDSDFSKYFSGKKCVLPFILNSKTDPSEYKLDEEGRKIIFSCGRLIYYKGFDILISAAKKINSDAVIHISGIGSLKNALEEKIINSKLSAKVKLLGKLSDEDLKKEYQNCYLYCFPSIERGEMLGMVQYEALSYGKPIISTNIPRSGAPTLNVEGVSGFHVPIKDSDSLAEKINLVLENEDLYKSLCRGAVKLSEEYNDTKIIKKYVDFFKNL